MTSGQETNIETLSGAQSRAARALLGWSQADLAQRARVGVSTVADFERGARVPVTNNLDAMRAGFESAGITFALGGAIVGPLPTFAIHSRVPGTELRPVRWVDETTLNSWADRISAREDFPELMRRLMLARFGYGAQIRFPSGGAIQLKGWDAQTNLKAEDALIPSGLAGWEFGVNQNIRQKADSDFRNRAKSYEGIVPAELAYVFATPRYWGAKNEWVEERRKEGVFREVRVIDGVDLAQLLEQTPSVSLWLAQKLGRVPFGVRLLADAWQEWAYSTAIPLTEQLILTGRDEQSTKIHRWLKEDASAFGMQGESTSEAIAFLYASLSEYPQEVSDAYQSRVVVVDTPEMAREIANVPVPLIVVLSEVDPGVGNLLLSKGHHVFQAFGSSIAVPDAVNVLPRIGRHALTDQLKSMLPHDHTRQDEERVYNLARDAAGSLTVLRRLMEAAPGLLPPPWARPDRGRAFLPLLLAGAWSDDSELDRKLVSTLAGIPYPNVQENLTTALASPESPVRRIGSIWKVASPRDAWFRLARYIISSDVEAFKEAAMSVLTYPDPVDDETSNWFTKRPPTYSEELKQGIVETLILFGVFGSVQKNVRGLEHQASMIVRNLLKDADSCRWRALAPVLQELAEASPEEFLQAVDTSLDSHKMPVMTLFEADNDSLFGRSTQHSNLLWAMEMLAWSAEYLPTVTSLLLRLGDVDPKQDSLLNRPENSLRHIYLTWFPQTNVPLVERMAILDAMRSQHPDAMWRLTMALYPQGHDNATNTPTPMWRSFDSFGTREIVTNGTVRNAAEILGRWILEGVGHDYARWDEVLDRLTDFPSDFRSALAEQLSAAAAEMSSTHREKLRDKLRQQLHRNRQFSEAGWSIPDVELAPFQAAYDSLEPTDPFSRTGWLFREYNAPLIHPPGTDSREEERLSRAARRDAIGELSAHGNLIFVRDFANSDSTINPHLVGVALADVAGDKRIWDVWSDLLAPGDSTGQQIAAGAINTLWRDGARNLVSRLLDKAMSERWPDTSVALVMASLPKEEELYRRLDASSDEVQKLFWRKVWPHELDLKSRGLGWVVRKLVANGRPYNAAELMHHHLNQAGSKLIVEVLDSILASENSEHSRGNDGVMLQYYVEHMFHQLDEDESFNQAELGRLEWAYLKVLENSKRPPRMLVRQLSTSPEFFKEILCLMYREKNSRPAESDDDDVSETVRRLARHANTLLHNWRELPGLSGNRIDSNVFNLWLNKARSLCGAVGRGEIADEKIGELFAHSPSDTDGTWPHSDVRSAIERLKSERVETGLYIGTRNKRGVTSRGLFDGGALEREEVEYYRGMATLIRLTSPRTAAVLARIARSYEIEAQQFDDEAARRDW
ncbi:helix-turn-helix domain-containing protein [Phyllobacterium sp. SYP-B3895]|uniref:helix-turn-helix domain-containing protein n=1 Tax=Phyllobacterium sp. SYP-B3895 TaxID=2663240 RepID=UPI0012998591|nr:helix-turn-helix transcriptional regulator [Phyllobacterium sp. SYP-B3895]MRG54587.1 helix-turn-helix domain-containing protein [Phyllobacterium sp. SYP-B3895]